MSGQHHRRAITTGCIAFLAAFFLAQMAATAYLPLEQERYSTYAILAAGVGLLSIIIGLIQ